MSRYYSFVVFALDEVELPEYGIIIERGPNAFRACVSDIEAFKNHLTTQGVSIRQVNSLDEFEPVPAEPEAVLEGTRPPILPGPLS